MVKKSVQVGWSRGRRCPGFGVFCFLCAFISSLFGAESASADAPVAAIKTAPLAAPAAVLGMTNPYIVAAAAKTAVKKPRVLRFTFSRDLVNFANRIEQLARDGVELNQRKLVHAEKLNLRVQSRLGGGLLQLTYRH